MADDWWQRTFPQGRQSVTITDAIGEDVAIAYGEIGTGPTIVLAHGIGSWSYSWRGVIPPLAEHYRVVCFDAKGSGYSQKPPPTDPIGHQVPELAAFIQAIAPGLVPEPVIVVGESLGALTALGVAQTYPDLIKCLVVINVPIFPDQLPSLGMQLLGRLPLGLVTAIDQGRLAKWFAPLTYQIARLERQQVLAANTQVTDEEVYYLTYPYLELPGTLSRFAHELQLGIQDIQRLGRGQSSFIRTIQDKLSAIYHDTLIVWSQDDRWFPVSHGQALCDRLPHGHFQQLPRCGHAASANCPQAVAQAVLRFLA